MTQRDPHEPFDFEGSRIALESVSDELWRDFKNDIHIRHEDNAIMARHLTAVEARFGFESLEDALAFTKRVAVAGQQRFGKFIESVQVFLDDTGQKEVDRLRGLLDQAHGDGQGIFVDAKLANRLQVNGDIPKSFDKVFSDFHQLSDRVMAAYVPHISEVVTKAGGVVGPQYPRTSEEFAKQIATLVTLVHHAGDPRRLLEASMFNFVGLGGRRLFQSTGRAPSTHTAGKEPGEPLSEIRRYVADGSVYKLNHKTGRVEGTAYNARLPVLDRSGARSAIEQCDRLSALIVKILAVAKHHAHDFDGAYIAGRLVANLKEMRGNVKKDAVTNVLHDTGQQVEHKERESAEVLGEYFRLSILDHLTLLESLSTLAIEMHKSLSAYVHASLNHYK